MHIFLDSNIFFDNWDVNNPNFRYLFNFINNEYHTLVLSKLVIEETENNRRKKVENTKSIFKRFVKESKKLSEDVAGLELKDFKYKDYSLVDVIKQNTGNFVVFDYEQLSHEEIVQRTLSDKKPFLPGEKGYRDTLIWLSFLDYLKSNKVSKDTIFISNNKGDFFKKKSEATSFHQDLLEDISSFDIKSKIIPFTSLYSFVNSQFDKEYHEIDHDLLIEDVEEFVEMYGIENLEESDSLQVAYRSSDGLYQTTIHEIISVGAEIIEGLEDPDIMHISKISKNEVRVGYSYNLRRVALDVHVSESNYLLNKEEFDEIFFEISIENEVAIMSVVARPYFFSSFIYHISDQSLNEFYVDEVSIKI
jgi:PIN domain